MNDQINISLITTFLHKFLTNLSDNCIRLLKGDITLSLASASVINCIKYLREVGFYPRIVTTPDKLKIYVNDSGTLSVNIPDQYVRKEYELHPEFIPKAGWSLLDVGAYVGIYTLRASRLVGGDGCVFAFEPNPTAYMWLKRNLFLNKCTNVTIFPLALGELDGRINLYCVTEGNIGSTSTIKKHIINKLGKYETITVQVSRLDSLSNIILKNKKYVDLAKIDVEGSELSVLRGCEKLLEKQAILRFVIEVHLDVIDTSSIESLLQSYKYRVVKVVRIGNVKEILYATATS